MVQHWHEDMEDARGKDLPSWVPIFHSPPLCQFAIPHTLFDATLSGETPEHVIIVLNGKELTVAAVLVDIVDNVLGTFPTGEHGLSQTVYSC